MQNSDECLQKIINLEDQIISNLKNFTKNEIDADDEKEAQRILTFYENCEDKSDRAMKKMKSIHDSLKNLVPKIKLSLFPDERKWTTWTGNDFRKFVFFLKRLIFPNISKIFF